MYHNDDGVRIVTVHNVPEYVGRCTKSRTRVAPSTPSGQHPPA